MTISKIIDKSKLPNQSQDQATFDAAFAQLLLDLVEWGAQVNAEAAAMNTAIAGFNGALAGNAYAIPYTVDLSSVADSDPGAGKLRFNSATQNAATVLRVDLVGADTADYTKSLDTFDSSTSTVKGTIRIVKVGDTRKFLVFNVTARATPAGYRNIAVTPVDSSVANPFVNGEQVVLFFQRTGDKGEVGPIGTTWVLYVRDEKPAGTSGGKNTGDSWVTRGLNATKINTISGASVSNNRITLPAGTYRYAGSAPAHAVAGHVARLQNVTDNITIDIGTAEYIGTTAYVNTRSFLRGQFTLSAARELEVQHKTASTNQDSTDGFGRAAGTHLQFTAEVYTEIMFEKVA